MTDSRPMGIHFAPGVLRALLNSQSQEIRAHEEGYIYSLGNMDVAQAALASNILLEHGIDHACPAGYVLFKTAQQRLDAIKLLHGTSPQRLGWKWRDTGDRPKTCSEFELSKWALNRPIDPQYLTDTTEDPTQR